MSAIGDPELARSREHAVERVALAVDLEPEVRNRADDMRARADE